MGYAGSKIVATTRGKQEIKLLESGLSYHAIANITGVKVGTLKERNRKVYHINIYEAFRRKISREGLPKNLNVNNDFGYYFTGLFDGEGTFVLWHRCRKRTNKIYPEFRLALQIALRDDDTDVLKYIQHNLGGILIHQRRKYGTTNPSICWKLERIKELAERMIPFFDQYPLHTKKYHEYKIWRPLVIERYLATLGGETTRGGVSNFEPEFLRSVTKIKAIRKYASSP